MAADRTSGLRRVIREEIAQIGRGPELGSVLGPALASAIAQQSGEGLGIQNVRRGVLVQRLTGAGIITIGQGGLAALSTPLEGTIFLSGRPLLIVVTGVAGSAGAGSDVRFSVLLRGADVTGGLVNGMPGSYIANNTALGFTAWWIEMAPRPGEASLKVVADANNADGSLYVQAGETAALLIGIEL